MSSEDSCPRRELRRPVSVVGSGSQHRINPCQSDGGSRSASLDQGFQTVEDIEEGIRLLPIDDATSFEIAKEVALSIHSFCADNANILKELVAFLHEKCLESSSFACRASAVFAALGQFEVAGIKFRDVLLRRIQADFMGREERRLKDHSKFLNSISTLCYVFRRVRLADGATIKILAIPVIKYMQLLLEYNRDDDIELFGSQLQILGPELAKYEQSQVDELMVTLRHKLTSSDFSDLSNSSRSYLVLALELYLLGWPTKLTDPVEAFYKDCLPKQGRAPPMETTKHHSDDEGGGGHVPTSSSSDLFLNESPMVESIRQMNLAALAAQMASLPQHHHEDMGGGHLHKGGGDMQHQQQQNNGGFESTNWSKDLETMTMWTPKTYSRPPPPIMNSSMVNQNRPNLHGSLSLNDYSNVRPNNMRR